MKLAWSWLHRHLHSKLSVAEVEARLVQLGLEVEGITQARDDLKDLFVVDIERIEAHPNADRLRLCWWRADKGRKGMVVCGAPNARVGLRSLLAPVGTQVKGWDKPLKAATIRGVKSEGMLCSAQELGIGDDAAGIIEIDESIPLGTQAHKALGLDEVVLDVALTPDRVDCASVRGIARDLAAAGCGTLKSLPSLPSLPSGPQAKTTPVIIDKEARDVCALFSLSRIDGVKLQPSPLWLQQALRACGVRCHNVLVDVSNYMMLDLGHPLHVYDAALVNGTVRVRLSKKNESFTALDGVEHKLPSGLLVVADDSSILALAGVMGGLASGCTHATGDVLVECAHFDPQTVAASGRALQLQTESRYRFERGVDVSDTVDVLARTHDLLIELTGGEAKGWTQAGSDKGITAEQEIRQEIPCDKDTVLAFGGVDIDEARVRAILSALGFVAGKKGWRVPSFRFDIHEPQDLVGEVLRVWGYAHIPSKPFSVPYQEKGAETSKYYGNREATVRMSSMAAARGFSQSINWAFISEEQARAFCVGEPLRLSNPLSRELAVMRPSLLSGLLLAVARNQKRGFMRGALFEHGAAWRDGNVDEQNEHLAFVRWGMRAERHWRAGALAKAPQAQVDSFDGKQDFYHILESWLALTGESHGRYALPPWFAGTQAQAEADTLVLGHYGMPTPQVCRQFDINSAVVMGEIYIDRLPKATKTEFAPYMPSAYQSVRQDFSFEFEAVVRAADILAAVDSVRKANPLIRDVVIFDRYQERGERAKISIGISVLLQSQTETLQAQTIKQVSDEIVEAVVKRCGGVLRDG